MNFDADDDEGGSFTLLSQGLEEEGYYIVDGAATPEWCASVRAEITALYRGGALKASKNKLRVASVESSNSATSNATTKNKSGIVGAGTVHSFNLSARLYVKGFTEVYTWLLVGGER